MVTGMVFGEIPVSMTCPRCQAQIVTSTIYQDGTLSWFLAAILCFFGCWPCCLIPFCLDGCKDVSHHCPNCRSHLGSFRRM
ncbi:LITAF-like zinc ribbon domain-containing protein [Salmonella sp. s54925]|uniref:LITAF-like zinc ribbon domain-containing protein n=1 Tax=Salmonella sp. s54925 TaxID=3159674 RepID=UPI0039816E31